MTKCSRCIATLGLILTVVTFCQSISELTRSELETRGSVEPSETQQLLLNKWRDNETAVTKPPLTGIPQVDYVHDPNLPRELQGYDLSDYPFYNRVPNVQFNFSCDDRHDGFYASIPHKCQVYHNCLFGVRYDFLCANYTAFDQSNFICHWANSVDCDNSELYYNRNEELYVEATTTTTTTAAPVVQIVYVDRETGNVRDKPGGGNRGGNRKKTTPKPSEYYYDDYEQGTGPVGGASQPIKQKPNTDYTYDDAIYYDDVTEKTTTTTAKSIPPKRRPNRPQKTRTGSTNNDRSNSRLEQRTSPQASPQIPDYDVEGGQPQRSQQEGGGQRGQPIRRRRKKTTTSTTTTAAPEYYDEYYDYYENEAGPSTTAAPQKKKQKPIPGARPTAADRRNALLTSRVSHLVPKAIPPTNSEPEEVESVVEEPPQPQPSSSRQKTRSSSTAAATSAPVVKENSPKSSSFDYYEYEDAPVARSVVPVTEDAPVLPPAAVNPKRRGVQPRLTRSQIDRARTRRHLIVDM